MQRINQFYWDTLGFGSSTKWLEKKCPTITFLFWAYVFTTVQTCRGESHVNSWRCSWQGWKQQRSQETTPLSSFTHKLFTATQGWPEPRQTASCKGVKTVLWHCLKVSLWTASLQRSLSLNPPQSCWLMCPPDCRPQTHKSDCSMGSHGASKPLAVKTAANSWIVEHNHKQITICVSWRQLHNFTQFSHNPSCKWCRTGNHSNYVFCCASMSASSLSTTWQHKVKQNMHHREIISADCSPQHWLQN